MNPYNRFVQQKIKTLEVELEYRERNDYGWGWGGWGYLDDDFTSCPTCDKGISNITCSCGFICLDCYKNHSSAECVFKTMIGEGFFG